MNHRLVVKNIENLVSGNDFKSNTQVEDNHVKDKGTGSSCAHEGGGIRGVNIYGKPPSFESLFQILSEFYCFTFIMFLLSIISNYIFLRYSYS